MIKQFFTTIIFSLAITVVAVGQDAVTPDHRAIASQQIKRLGLKPQEIEFKKEDVEIFSSCSNGLWDPGDPEYLIVRFTLKVPKVLGGISLEKGAYVTLCDGKVSFIISPGVHTVDGYKCKDSVNFDLQGKLCECKLAEATSIEGMEIPKGVTTLWRKGKPYAINVGESVKIKDRLLEGGHHQFIKGKLKFQKLWGTVDTCGEEIYNQ